jgi:hypothetical protein
VRGSWWWARTTGISTSAILLRAGAAGGRQLVVVTVVHCHNWLGRTYLAVIRPFHRAIARANLEQAARVDL